MIRKLKIATLFASLALAASASEAVAKCTLKYEPLAITLDDLKPLIDATANGHKVRFVLDSGAFFSMITPGTAAALGLKLHAAPFGLQVVGAGGEVETSVVVVDNFEVAGSPFHHVEFLTGGSETGEGTAGVIGQNFLHMDDVEYDLANGTVRIVRPEGCKGDLGYWPSKSGYSGIDLVTFDDKWATTAYVEVNGQRLKAEFDTGAGVSFLTLAAARRLGFNPKGPGVEEAGTDYGFGPKPFRTWIMYVDSFKIGSEEVKHTRLRVGDTSFGEIDMLIGPDFFLSHHVYVANARKRVVFSYNGGPVFDLRVSNDAPAPARTAADPTPPAVQGAFAAEPTDADSFARRGAAFTERKDYAHAIADLTKAHELAPKEAGYLYLRAVAYGQNGQPFLAAADIDAALALAPDNVDARIFRASIRLSGRDPVGAVADADTVDKILPSQADQRLQLAFLYNRARAYAPAARQYDLWIKAHPDDARIAMALNGRCWAGAMSGSDLDAALVACDGAIRRSPKMGDFLDSRGLVHLRRGETDKAISDYNAALAINPKIAWSLYGRALAEQRKGMADAAKADFAAAAAINPNIADTARSVGLQS